MPKPPLFTYWILYSVVVVSALPNETLFPVILPDGKGSSIYTFFLSTPPVYQKK